MKVVTQVMTVLIAVNSITANTTLAQRPNEAVLQLVQEQLATKDAQLAEEAAAVQRKVTRVALQVGDQLASEAADLAKRAADLKNQEAKMQADVALQLSRLKLASALGRRGSSVLMVLTSQMKPEDVAATTEDLNIMSRIFDKKLGSGYAGTPRTTGVSSTNVSGLSSLLRHRGGSQGTQAIYLHGYAALFLMNVDFPLAAPPKVDVEKSDKDVDPVWEGAKREISASGKTRDQDYVYVKYDSAKEYDAEKVQDLKTNLTKALRHAANIRNLKPDELIILAVAGTQQPAASVAEIAVEGKKTYRVIANVNAGPTFSGAVLTIRAKKSDIDAYAKAQLTLEQFRERVQFVTSYMNSGAAQSNGTGFRSIY